MSHRPARLVVPAIIAVAALLAAGVWARATRPGLAHGAHDGGSVALEAAIADIEAGRKTTPLVGGPTSTGDVTVTFLAKSPGRMAPRIVSDVTGWGENAADETFSFEVGRMKQVGATDWYSLETPVARGARIEYFVVYGKADYRLDAHNPRRTTVRAGGPASELVTPGYVPPEDFAGAPPVPAGSSKVEPVESRALGGPRRAIVYTPPGYRRDMACPVAVFPFGVRFALKNGTPPAPGEATVDWPLEPDAPPRMLDQLIARKAIEPIVAVFLESHRYGDDPTSGADALRTFLTREVRAWVVSRYGVARSADKWAVLAISFGAKDAFDAAVASPAAYGRVGLLIPGRRLRFADSIAMVGRADHRLRATILAGRYDTANLATAHNLRKVFIDAGHAVDYIEVAEGHNQATWRNHMQDVLISLFGIRTPDAGLRTSPTRTPSSR